MTQHHAACRCGQVQIHFSQAPRFQLICHCQDCRAASGQAFLAGAFFAHESQAIIGSTRQESATGGSGKPKHSHFCAACGDFMYVEVCALPGVMAVNGAALQAPFVFTPEAHVWLSQALPEMPISDGLPTYAGPPPFALVKKAL